MSPFLYRRGQSVLAGKTAPLAGMVSPKLTLGPRCQAALLSLLLISSLTLFSRFPGTHLTVLTPLSSHRLSPWTTEAKTYAAKAREYSFVRKAKHSPRAVVSPDMVVIYNRRVSSILNHMDARTVRNISSW